MPGPPIQMPELPWWADPKKASVLDPYYITLARKLAHYSGLDDPNSAMQMGATAAMPLVSIYKSIPEREAAEQTFRALAKLKWPDPLAEAAEKFADKYPRIAAHINPDIGMGRNPRAPMSTQVPNLGVKEPVNVNVSPMGAQTLYSLPPAMAAEAAENFMQHEGTHVAQALGNNETSTLYGNSLKMVGYPQNAFEIAARAAEPTPSILHPSYQNSYSLRGGSIKNELLAQAEGVGKSSTADEAAARAARGTKTILQRREQRGWTPNPNYRMQFSDAAKAAQPAEPPPPMTFKEMPKPMPQPAPPQSVMQPPRAGDTVHFEGNRGMGKVTVESEDQARRLWAAHQQGNLKIKHIVPPVN
jgi:hypothetical protein